MAKHKTETVFGTATGAAIAMEEPVVERAVEPTGSLPVVEPAESPSAPEYEQIAKLAYSYWQARGCPDSSPEEDWFRAEADLQKQTTPVVA
jgi:hypothetical protein